MDKRTTDIVCYLSWVGLALAFIMGDRENSRFHLNQSLVLNLAATVFSWIPWIGWALGIFCAVCWFIAIVSAIQGVEKEVPLLGQIKLYQ